MPADAAPNRWMSFIDIDEFVDPAPALPIKTTEKVFLGRFGGPQFVSEFDEDAMAARRK